MEFSNDESSENETEPLAARIARQSRTTKAKVKYTLSDDDDDDGNNLDDNDDKASSEDEWMNIKSSESEDELSMIKVQKQPSKKTVKFAATTKADDKKSEKTTGGVKEKTTGGVKEKTTGGVKEKTTGGIKEKTTGGVKEKTTAVVKKKTTAGVKTSVVEDKATDEIEIMDDDELPTATKLPVPAEKPKKKVGQSIFVYKDKRPTIPRYLNLV